MSCVKCGEADNSKFYGNKRSYCAKCHNEYTVAKRKENKKYALAKYGHSCAVCGFSAFPEGLSFHHTNPAVKDVDFKNILNWSRKRIDSELTTCLCVCLNCHAGVHAGHILI